MIRESVPVCLACGTHFATAKDPPEVCPICEDVRGRGAVARGRQRWTTLGALREKHRTVTREHEPGLTGIGLDPTHAAGQRALLVETPEGNVLWDCIPTIDEAGIDAVRDRGGIAAIAISHPHFYQAMVEWSHAFDHAPVYVHDSDREWVMRPDPAIRYWTGELQALPGAIRLIRCGGHFDGATVLHWPAGADGRGALLTGDVMSVTPDRHVSFMYAYPNLVPLPPTEVTRVVKSVEPYDYERLYGGWFWTRIERDAKAAVARSAERYIRAIGAES